jgi:AraC family transcriptional regulator, regulatory protein of adaptative response / methylated-DNA-[protein]-cysteine methyltransferase
MTRNSDSNTQHPIRFAIGPCWLGSVLVGVSDRGVCATLLGDDPEALIRELRQRFPDARPATDGGLKAVLAKIAAFVETPSDSLDVPLDVRGTAFERRVWDALRRIPAGSTASYGEIAERLGAPATALDVGAACAANIIAVAIPCHRVVRKNGRLAGYRWGVARKRALLDREAARSFALSG